MQKRRKRKGRDKNKLKNKSMSKETKVDKEGRETTSHLSAAVCRNDVEVKRLMLSWQ